MSGRAERGAARATPGFGVSLAGRRVAGPLARRGRCAGVAGVGALALVFGAGPGSTASAQDLEVLARRSGVPLPAVYYTQVASDPTAYSFARAFFNRSAAAAGLRTAAGTVAHRTAAATRGAPSLAPMQGTLRLPVVLALFSDSPEPHISRETIQTSLFKGPSVYGTITQAYLEMSRGALSVEGVVFPWVRTSGDLATVVADNGGLGTNVGTYLTEALDLVDPAVDFAQYDNDGADGLPNSGDDDGYVDVITFEYLEVAASCGGPAIWPHRWTLAARTGAPYETNDLSAQDSVSTVRVDDYITQSVADCGGVSVQDASTISHEFGHALGLPDYYHAVESIGPLDRRWVMGCWALMAGGAWGCGSAEESRGHFGPTHLMAYSKHQLGWVDFLEVGEVRNQEVFLDPVQTSGVALRIPLDDEGVEFLIAEYRGQSGFDRQLPAAGVVMYRQNLEGRPQPPPGDPYFLTLLERDGNRGLQRTWHEGGNRGEAGDAWGVDGHVGELHAQTMPELRLSDGGATSVTVHEISLVDGRARMVVSTAPTPQIIAPAEPLTVMRVRSFLASMRVAGGTMPYTAAGTVPEGVVFSSAGDDVLVAGSLLEPGPFELRLSVTDALGQVSPEVVLTLNTTEWITSSAELLQPFLDSDAGPLTPGEMSHLDALGNQNGMYDVGDLRAWLTAANRN